MRCPPKAGRFLILPAVRCATPFQLTESRRTPLLFLCRIWKKTKGRHSLAMKTRNLMTTKTVTPLFTRPAILKELAADVRCGLASAKESMRPTGVPPYIALLNSLETCSENIKSVGENLVPDVVSGVTGVLEERAIGAGTVTRDGLSEMLTEVFESSSLYDSLTKVLQAQSGCVNTSSSSSSSGGQHSRKPLTPYVWGGRFHLVPQDFTLPDGSALQGWQHYLCGNESRNYPPLRLVTPEDMASKNLRKRLSDFKFLMRAIEDRVKAADKWIESPSVLPA